MPSARPSQFRGAAGILRDVDATIVNLTFTDKNPLSGTGKQQQNRPGYKKSDFHSLFGVLEVLVDGSEKTSLQPIFVGSADDFGYEGATITGDGQLSKSSGWFIFLDSLVRSGFDETSFPDDDPNVADYSSIIGARVRFNWQKNEKATKKYGQKKSADGKKAYDREDLIVTNYYGQADPVPASQLSAEGGAAAAPAKTTTSAKTTTARGGAKSATKSAATVDIAKVATDNIVQALAGAKDHTLSKQKLSVKLLTALSTAEPEVREAVREWAFEDKNLSGIEGVNFDATKQTLSLEE